MLERKLKDISVKLVELYTQMDTSEAKATQGVYDKAIELYSAVGQFIEALEEADENLDPEKTNIPNLDHLFLGNPVTEYVEAVMDVLSGAGKMGTVLQAAQKLAQHQAEPEEKDEMPLADYVTQFGFGELDPEEVMDVIQNVLDRRTTEFSEDDHKLIRFYLKQKPFNNPEEIDQLSPRALELAWKRFKYMRTVK